MPDEILIKPSANTITIGTSNTNVGFAKVVYITNTQANVALISFFDIVANTQYASIVIDKNQSAVVIKSPNNVITSNASAGVFGTPVGYA